MTEANNEVSYAIFQTIACDDFTDLINTLPKPCIFLYSKKISLILKRVLSDSSYETCLSKFSDHILLKDVTDKSKCKQALSVCAFCLDDANKVKLACEKLKILNDAYKFKYLVLIPRITTICQQIVEKSNLDIHMLELPIEIIPLEEKMFLVPSQRSFTRCFADNDINDVYTIARSLLKFQILAGSAQRTFVAGNTSSHVFSLLDEMKKQYGSSRFKNPQFSDLFIIDRTVDLITPLLSQFSYGGLLDDMFDIEFGTLKLPDDIDIMNHPGQREVILSDFSDACYKQIKNIPLTSAYDYIKDLISRIEKIQVELKEKKGTVAWGNKARNAVKLLEEKTLAKMHLSLMEKILAKKPFIIETSNYEYNALIQNTNTLKHIYQLITSKRIVEALRLLCLISLAFPSNISTKDYEQIQKRIINQCGFRATSDLLTLENSGFFPLDFGLISKLNINTPLSFSEKKDLLNLIVSDLSSTDIQQGYDRYVPLIHRLVQGGLNGKWNKGEIIDKVLSKMNVPHQVFNNFENQTVDQNVPASKVLVFIIGGATLTEISLFEEMGRIIFNNSFEFYVGTTNVINGPKIIKSTCPYIAKKSK